ncbi:MAG: fibronectin type III domain-containing protein [Bacteroidota bacterium]
MKRYIYLISCLFLFAATAVAQKITLTPAMLSYYQGQGNTNIGLGPLADEQASITGAISDNTAAPLPTSVWIPSWGANPTVQVNLGSTYALSQLNIFDSWNMANLTIKYDNNGTWAPATTWNMSYDHRWKSIPIVVQTSKLLLEFSGLNAQIGELSVSGSLVGAPPPPPPPTPDTQVPTAPANLAASGLTTTSVNLAWTASTDNVGVTGYNIYNGSALLSTVTGTTKAISGLTASTTYLFTVKAKDAANNQSVASNSVTVVTSTPPPPPPPPPPVGTCTPAKLTLTAAMLTNESGKGDAGMLVDEQALAGNPAQGQGGTPSTSWFTGWNATDHPASAYIDFGSTATIASIFLRDVNDAGGFMVQSGSPGNWTMLFTDNLNGYQSWNQHNVTIATRYLRFTRQSQGANVSEVVIYGCVGPVTPPTPDVTPPSAVANLTTSAITGSSIQLNWTATGDDGMANTAASYDLRYSTAPIISANFGSASQAAGEPAPLVAGTAQSFVVTGLTAATTYYFALRVSDEVPNVSAISNIVSAKTTITPPPPPPPPPGSKITVDKFMGANAFVDDPISKMQAVGFIREYHNWNWDEGDIWSGGGNVNYPGYPNNQIKWAPSQAGGGVWNFDTYYTSLKNAGLGVSPAIQGSVKWLHGGLNFGEDDKPIDEPGASTTNPNSYEKKSHHMFQYAARYGSTTVADNKLTLAPGQPRNTGMNLIKYIEDWNEQDKNWRGPNAEFSAQEYAAMASADYDGHAKTMHQGSGTFGVKNADPNMKMVMGGIFRLDLDYIKQMKAWFTANRADHKFAADVINLHYYSWKDDLGPQGGGPALSPEESDFKGKLKPFVDYRNQHLPGVEVWVSEFGWDTNPGSPLAPPPIGPFDLQEIQGQWLVRAYLALAAAGVDRAQMYMLRDVNPSDPTWFSTSGLVGPKDDWTPKKSWYYVSTMKKTLTNMLFLGEVASTDPNVLIYKFKDVNSANGAYVVWAKTKSNYTVNYSLTLAGAATTANKVEMVAGDADGVSTPLSITAGKVSVNVSERPVFIKVNTIQ